MNTIETSEFKDKSIGSSIEKERFQLRHQRNSKLRIKQPFLVQKHDFWKIIQGCFLFNIYLLKEKKVNYYQSFMLIKEEKLSSNSLVNQFSNKKFYRMLFSTESRIIGIFLCSSQFSNE
jgi:hypothetical protein